MNNQINEPIVQGSQKIGTIISTILITAIIIGGGVWWWQKSALEKEKEDLQQQIEELKNQVSSLSAGQETENIIQQQDQFADWKTYRNEEYGYEFKYPSYWNLAGNQTIWEGNGFNKDKIQINQVAYSDRNSYLNKFDSDEYTQMFITNGQGYYYIEETMGGPSPTIYLVGDEEILLMNYNIFDVSKTSLIEAETLFNQILSTFKFIDIDSSDWKTYQNNEYGFEIKYPSYWKAESGPVSNSFTFGEGDWLNDWKVNINICEPNDSLLCSSYLKDCKKIILSEKEASICEIISRITQEKGKTVDYENRIITVQLKNNNRIYFLSLSGDKSLDKFEIFEKMLLTFKLL